jgi:hypothetical protein
MNPIFTEIPFERHVITLTIGFTIKSQIIFINCQNVYTIISEDLLRKTIQGDLSELKESMG